MLDWKKPSDYPNEQDSYVNWKWEFVRRNPEYKVDFKIMSGIDLQSKWGLTWLCDPDEVGIKVDMLMDSNKAREHINNSYIFLPTNYPIKFLNDGEVWKHEIRHKDKLHPLNNSQVAIVFDCARPIQVQINEAKIHLENNRKHLVGKETRNRLKMYSTYLRVLDATSIGISKAKIAEVFELHNEYPDYLGEKTVNNWINAANKLMNGQYKNL